MREKIFFPFDRSPGQMMAAWSTALAAAAIEIGLTVKARLDSENPKWVSMLEDRRRDFVKHYRVDIQDPSWVFTEPRYRESPVARLLGAKSGYDFGKVSQRRNDWFHRNAPWNLDELTHAIRDLQVACAYLPELPVNAELKELMRTIAALHKHNALPSPNERALRDLAEQSRDALEQARGELQEMQQRLRVLVARTAEGADLAALVEQEIAQARARAADAEQEAENLQLRLQEMEEQRGTSADPDDLLPTDIRPGDAWPSDVPLGRRRMRLHRAPQQAIWDVAEGVFAHEIVGDRARLAAARWQVVMPLGGDIWVTEGWHSAGSVNGRTTYLGRLDEPPEQDEVVGATIQGFLVPQTYRVSGRDVMDDTSQELLSSRIGIDAALEVTASILEALRTARDAGLMDEEGLEVDDEMRVLRLTVDGHVAASMAGELGYLVTIGSGDWFPGVMRDR